jgi:hypothetical protein
MKNPFKKIKPEYLPVVPIEMLSNTSPTWLMVNFYYAGVGTVRAEFNLN